MQALISDIHSNIEAFSAVLKDIKDRAIKDVICLGDVIGYGPNPKECVDIASKLRLSLLGNHEEAVLHVVQAQGFNRKASSAVRWTAAQFDMLGDQRRANAERWNFLGGLTRSYASNGVLLAHGSPHDPTREYVHVSDVRNPNKMERIFSLIEHVCFVGHTHVPGAWTEDLNYYRPAEIDYVYHIDERKVVINVGSVGQPRDYDSRASYAIFDGATVRWVRVPYDIDKTVAKVYSIDMLDNSTEAQDAVAAYRNAVAVSALRRQGLDDLLAKLEDKLAQSMVRVRAQVPYAQAELLALFHQHGLIEIERHGESGVLIEGRLPSRVARRFEPYLA